MKNLIFIVSVFFLISCSGNSSENKENTTDEQNNTKTEETQKEENSSEAKSGEGCEEFLDDYEAWADEVVKLMKNIKENPSPKNAQKMMEASQKVAKWSEKWTALYECSQNEEYAARMEKIKERVEKELGSM